VPGEHYGGGLIVRGQNGVWLEMKISVTIIVKNEEGNIGDCLASLDFADEIVVVDSGSTDGTADICRSHPKVRFFEREWEGFGKQKNMVAELASHDWIFNIDADERVLPELEHAIVLADFDQFCAFRVSRRNHFAGRWISHCGWYPDYNLRLYDRRKCRFSERAVHESIEPSGKIGSLSGDLLHYTYSGISDYLKRMDRYSSLAATQIIQEGRSPGVTSLLVRPIHTFVKMYFLKRGFLEGYTGFLLSVLYAQYTFLKYSKAIEMRKVQSIPS